MKRLLSAVIVGIVLLATGFVAFDLLGIRSQLMANTRLATVGSQTTPIALPTVLVGFPDIEYMPIYPNANVTEAVSHYSNNRNIVYEVAEREDRIAAFYQDMLAEKGWSFRSADGGQSRYTWADPSGKLPWHIYLEVTIGLTLAGSNALVQLNYGRYPDTGEGLKLYSDASAISTSHSSKEEPSITEPEKVQVQITDITYLSRAKPQAIADFYNRTMPEYGWFFSDRAKHDSSTVQDGDITSQEGLYFAARYRSWKMGTSEVIDMFITATVAEDGQTMIHMHIEESESLGRGP